MKRRFKFLILLTTNTLLLTCLSFGDTTSDLYGRGNATFDGARASNVPVGADMDTTSRYLGTFGGASPSAEQSKKEEPVVAAPDKKDADRGSDVADSFGSRNAKVVTREDFFLGSAYTAAASVALIPWALAIYPPAVPILFGITVAALIAACVALAVPAINV